MLTLENFTSNEGELNVHKLLQLNDEQFFAVLLANSRSYIENHGRAVVCQQCEKEIKLPHDLIRYFGTNLHPACFAQVYPQERARYREREQDYFDRVLKIISAQSKFQPGEE